MEESEAESNCGNRADPVVIAAEQIKRKTLVAPWKNVEEFNQVYSWIYGENANNETKQLACRQMIVWKVRRLDLTPAAVLGTLVILQIQLKDARLGPNATKEQKNELRLMYSSAFTRFFNYMSSIMQTQNMKTMYETAKELNLRSFIVDLRHICAHGLNLPSLDMLQSTSKYCLKWLQDFYWKMQSECMRNVHTSNIRRKDQTQFERNVMELFQFYDATLACVLNGEKKFTKKYIRAENLKPLKTYVGRKMVAKLSLVLDEITKDLLTMAKQEKNMMDLSDIYIEAILRMKYFFELIETHITTDEKLEVIIRRTQGLFRLLAICGFIEDFFHSLLAIVENKNEEVLRRKAAGFWANQMVIGFIAYRKCKEKYKHEKEQDPNMNLDLSSLNFENTSKKLLSFYTQEGFDVKKLLIFGGTTRRPWVWTFSREFVEERIKYVNEYSIEILKNVLSLVVPEFTESEKIALTQLFDLRIIIEKAVMKSDEVIGDGIDDRKVYTVDDVREYYDCTDLDAEIRDSPNDGVDGVKRYGIWSTVPDCQDWYSCPIGSLIWD